MPSANIGVIKRRFLQLVYIDGKRQCVQELISEAPVTRYRMYKSDTKISSGYTVPDGLLRIQVCVDNARCLYKIADKRSRKERRTKENRIISLDGQRNRTLFRMCAENSSLEIARLKKKIRRALNQNTTEFEFLLNLECSGFEKFHDACNVPDRFSQHFQCGVTFTN